jgi:ketopantoate reductase
MEIKVIGAGAIGSLIGGLFSVKGFDVFFSQNPGYEEISPSHILRIILPDRWLTVEGICKNGSRKAEMLFVTVKRHQLKSLTKEYLSQCMLHSESEILFFNCDRYDMSHIPLEDTTFSICLSLLCAVKLQPGDVELCSTTSYLIIEKKKHLKKLFSLLKDFGIQVFYVDDIEPYANSFFLSQLLFLPVAMCNTTLTNFLSYREGRELAIRVLHEGIKTFEKSSMPLGKLPVMDPQELIIKLQKKPKKFDTARYKSDRAFNSLLQSILLEKQTEVKELNGRLIIMAKEAGVDPAWNWALMQKLPRVQRLGFYMNPAELLKGIK